MAPEDTPSRIYRSSDTIVSVVIFSFKMATTNAGTTLLLPSPASTPAKRTTRMMLGRKADSLGTHGMKLSSSSSSSSSAAAARATSTKDGVGTILKMEADKLWKLLDRKEREEPMVMVADPFALGEVGKDRRIFCENFTIRSYDMGPNRTATIETLMNLLQETALNHIRSMGILKDGLGSTPAMSGRSLIWVLSKMHIVVDHYPSWGDDVEVNNWFIASEKNGQRTDWMIRDRKTGRSLARATSTFLTMNKETRKLSKIPEEVRREMETICMECSPIPIPDDHENSSASIAKFDCNRMDGVRTGLTPRWNDLDSNQHVNNVKYIGLMLESVPISMLKSHEICEMKIEYRRECRVDNALQSQTSSSEATDEYSVGAGKGGHHECFHFLRFENGAVVAKGRTKWRAK
ncbi:palmitoyl-acyl carrier protein thioesterase, chloroplastic-like [Macadamia integrifolia]|uniref:palmitoyl-acyl carrier protein thioesterase, chloroplastic-like n=1 Tax=Macadamia integrifolia TaxID=60698 RepID=UPI001C52EE17|nr:palmitoyl-acyl carrier protein thioesterase, chloroplastic-like [Macadamia integrifolia]